MSLENAGLVKMGEIGPFAINTDGGQLSAGQLNPAGASGCQQIAEAVRQIRGLEPGNQLARHDIGLVNT